MNLHDHGLISMSLRASINNQNKIKKEIRDRQTWFTTSVKIVVYLREHLTEPPFQLLQPLLKIIKQADQLTTLLQLESSENKLKDPIHIPEDEVANKYVKLSTEGKTLTGIFKIIS